MYDISKKNGNNSLTVKLTVQQKSEIEHLEHKGGMPTAMITVKCGNIRYKHNDTVITTEGLRISALNPWQFVLCELIAKIYPHLLGPDKTIIPFDYQKQIGGEVYSKLLINNNEFHNNNTGLPIYNVLTDILDTPMYLPNKAPTTLFNYVRTLGFISIEPSTTSNNDGRHFCIIPWTRWDKIRCALENNLDEKLSYIGDGTFSEQYKAKFVVYPSVGNVKQLTGTVHQMSDRIKDCIIMTDAQQDLKNPDTNAGNDITPGSSLKNGNRKYSDAHKLDITDITCKFPKLTVSTVPP